MVKLEKDFAYQETLNVKDHLTLPYSNNYDFLAINVPSTFQQGMIPDGDEPSWGLLRVVAAAREKHGFNAGMLDAHSLKLESEKIKEQLQKAKPKLVGLNPTSVNVPEAQLVADICDELDIPYVLGGVHATVDPQGARNDFPTSYAIVRGHGEHVINGILKRISGEKMEKEDGVYYQEDPISETSAYAYKMHPEDIPLVRQEIYLQQPFYVHNIFRNGISQQIRESTLYVTDGCPFSCTFCSSPVMVNRGGSIPYQRPSMNRIVTEVKNAIDSGADAIHFLDDMAFVNGQHIKEFHDEITNKKLLGKFIWRGLTRVPVLLRDNFNTSTTEIMKESGAWKIGLGIESGSDEILRRINKSVTTSQVIGAIKNLTKQGIQSKGFFILGFPDETERQMQETLSFISTLQEIGLTEISVFQFKPYPGTAEYSQLRQKRPDVFEHLVYSKQNHDISTDVVRRKADDAVWLPDDLKIAEVSSGVVKNYILKALDNFYGNSEFGLTQAYL